MNFQERIMYLLQRYEPERVQKHEVWVGSKQMLLDEYYEYAPPCAT
ncbi:hypothetical protein HYX14_04555 [Candidatus Woesearchaeota archaeon]|nr:hypothetical protein [Candidatus Woesearchaeota archaeon]